MPPLFTIKGFRGINNIADPVRIPPANGIAFLSRGANLEIDNEFMIHTREGHGSTVFSGTDIHSLYSYRGTFLFVHGSDLKTLLPGYSSSTLREVGTAPMSYVGVQDRIYFTNSSVLAYVKGGAVHDFPVPDQTFKSPMKAGHLIEWYNGRLYVARGGVLWFSDPAAPGQTDERKNFNNLGGHLTLLRAVRDGIFVSNGQATYFLAGLDPNEFASVKVDSEGAIPGTAVLVDGESVGPGEIPGQVLLWLSPGGICLGGPGGIFKKITKDFYRPPETGPGSAIFRKTAKGFYQYMVSQRT